MDKAHAYKNYTISLEAEHRESGWICKYSVNSMNPQITRSHGAYSPANFSTEEEAEQSALQNAKDWIDNHPSPEIAR